MFQLYQRRPRVATITLVGVTQTGGTKLFSGQNDLPERDVRYLE